MCSVGYSLSFLSVSFVCKTSYTIFLLKSAFSFTHSIWLQNQDKHTPISWLRCRIVDQPSGFGGPSLVELIESEEVEQEETEQNDLREEDYEVGQDEMKEEKRPKPQKPPKKLPNEVHFGRLKPSQKKQVNIRLFGIDPASTTTAQETQVIFRIKIINW